MPAVSRSLSHLLHIFVAFHLSDVCVCDLNRTIDNQFDSLTLKCPIKNFEKQVKTC